MPVHKVKRCCGTCEYGIFEEGEEDGVCIEGECYIPIIVEPNHECEKFISSEIIKADGYSSNNDFYETVVNRISEVLKEIQKGANIRDVSKMVANVIFEVDE